MKITLSTTNNTYLIGWYGATNSTKPYDLEQISQYLHSVHKIGDDNYTWEMYKPANEENDFTQLEVGNIYYLNFYSVNRVVTIEIPNLFSSSGNIEDFDRGILEGVEDLDETFLEKVETTDEEISEDDDVPEMYITTDETSSDNYDASITESTELNNEEILVTDLNPMPMYDGSGNETPTSEFNGQFDITNNNNNSSINDATDQQVSGTPTSNFNGEINLSLIHI